jgi:hypothetical protein
MNLALNNTAEGTVLLKTILEFKRQLLSGRVPVVLLFLVNFIGIAQEH